MSELDKEALTSKMSELDKDALTSKETTRDHHTRHDIARANREVQVLSTGGRHRVHLRRRTQVHDPGKKPYMLVTRFMTEMNHE